MGGGRYGESKIAACVCLGETFTSSLRGSRWCFSSKDINFFSLVTLIKYLHTTVHSRPDRKKT